MTATHLLGLRELEPVTIQQLLDEADTWATDANGGSEILRGRRVGTVFYEPSTRTEISFELAARRLGAEVVRCDVEHSSVKKGESLLDTGRTLEALGLDALVLRHPCAGASHLLARAVRCAVINAGDGMHEHPTQGLVDLLTVRQTKGHVAGLQVAIVGDILHSRVARSALWGFTKLGARVRLVGPRTLLPTDVEALGAETASSLDEGLRGADVVMALRMQLERQRGGDVPSLAEYARMYEITPAVLSRLSPALIVLHPGPINPGVDVDPVVAAGAQSVITRQVTNGIPVRMAVLRWALEGAWRDTRVEDRRVANLVSVAATAN